VAHHSGRKQKNHPVTEQGKKPYWKSVAKQKGEKRVEKSGRGINMSKEEKQNRERGKGAVTTV